MDEPEGRIIQRLREALGMSRAEFARAAGWAPSTISSWERGRTRPNRVAFKTILAFAAERGVRYRPRASRALVPIAATPTSSALLDAHPAESAARFARSDGPSPAQAHEDLQPLRDVSPRPDPAKWTAEASFRVSVGRRHPSPRRPATRRLQTLGLALSACVLVALVGVPNWSSERGAATPPSTPERVADRRAVEPHGAVTLPADDTGVEREEAVDRSSTGGTVSPDPEAFAGDATVVAAAAESAIPEVRPRLESVFLLGSSGRATFRTAGSSVTVYEGEELGDVRIDTIESDTVTLVDANGTVHTVRLGRTIPPAQ